MKDEPKRTEIDSVIDEVLGQLHNIINGGKEALPKDALWEAYTKLEHAILLLKLERDLETAGGFEFTKPDKKKEGTLLATAVEHLERGRKELGGGDAESAISYMRKSRDALKLLLLKS